MVAPGGAQVQIEQTKTALEKVGVEVELLRWWDEKQTGDVIHHFGRVPIGLLRLAQGKGFKVVMCMFLSGVGARPPWKRWLHRLAIRLAPVAMPEEIMANFDWASYRCADACLAMTPLEASLATSVFGAPPSRVHVVPNGVEEVFLQSKPVQRGPWLVCTASIIELKQVLKLAQMAVVAGTPLWVIGKPQGEPDEYARKFIAFAKQNSAIIRYAGPISDRSQMASAYREARGFVLLSRWESLSLSALEAAACECPLMLSDLPWAHGAFGERASYCPPAGTVDACAPILRRFYDSAPQQTLPPKPMSWLEVARKLKAIYEGVVTTS